MNFIIYIEIWQIAYALSHDEVIDYRCEDRKFFVKLRDEIGAIR
jgi:hypothetical protein